MRDVSLLVVVGEKNRGDRRESRDKSDPGVGADGRS